MPTSPLRPPTPLRRLPALAALLLLAACEIVTGPDVADNGEGFTVRAGSGRLVLRNDAVERVHYVAIEEQTSHLVDLNPNATEWPAVAPGTEVVLPYRELNGYHDDAEAAVVFWWYRGQGGRLRVQLR